jgi:hypothetical protein
MLLEIAVFGSEIQFRDVFFVIFPTELIVPTFDKCNFLGVAHPLLILLQ